MEKQAKIINEERSAAQDRETRMKNKVQDLEKIVPELSGSVGDVLKTQAKALRQNKEDSAKIARQLNDLKEMSTPHTCTNNDTSAVPKNQPQIPEMMRSPQIIRRKTSENANLVLPAPKRSSVGVQTLDLVKEHLLGLTNLTKRASHGQRNQRWYNIRVLNQHKKMNGWTQFEGKNE